MFHPKQSRKQKKIVFKREYICPLCGNPKEECRKGSGYCLKCHARYMRENRPKHSELTEEQRIKANARAYANVYLNRGKIKKKNCIDCGSEKSQMHHDDYSKPLEVIWLCRECRQKRHLN